jgi:dipeptidyl aminopeptidase/acylaminoacyl peptidase
MTFDPRIDSLARFEPHPYRQLEQERAFVIRPHTQARYAKYISDYDALTDVTVERLTYKVGELRIQGVLVAPSTITPGKHPILIYNRGGSGEFGKLAISQIMHYLVPFARLGYLVFASNYRGNDGSDGEDTFGTANGDVQDVLTLLDITQKHPGWDGKNIFMLGGSRGGMMTFLSIKHGAKLNAAATFAALSDLWQSSAERPDIESNVYAKRVPDFANKRAGLYDDRSAIKWSEVLIDTPLLLMHGDADEQVNVSQTIELAAALAPVHKDHHLVIYHGGNHSLSTHAKEMLTETHAWFEAHRA